MRFFFFLTSPQNHVDIDQRRSGLFGKEMDVTRISRPAVNRSGQHRCDNRTRAGTARRIRVVRRRRHRHHVRRIDR